MQACVITPVVCGAGTPEALSFPRRMTRGTERREAQRLSHRCRLAAAPERISPAKERHARLAALHPAKLAQAGLCHGRRFRSPGPCFRGADRWSCRSLRDRTPPVPAGFGPRSSYPVQPLRAAPLSWGGRQTQGVPDAGCETCARAPHRARATSPARAPTSAPEGLRRAAPLQNAS